MEQFMLLFRFIVVTFLAVVLLAGFIWIFGTLNTTFIDIGAKSEGKTGGANLSYAAEITFGKVNNSIQALRLVALAIIFAEIMFVVIFNSFTRVHPALFIVWIFIVILAVIFAAPVSNAYERMLQLGIYDGELETFTGGNFILLNLPWFTLLVGIMGGIFMFINILRQGNEQAL